MNRLLRFALVLTLVAAFALPTFASTVTLINNDPANRGLNDPTPATPVGGNPGTTIGEQRLNALRHAAQRWADTLASDVPIVINVGFVEPFPACDASSAVLAFARPLDLISDFPNAPLPRVLYPVALANKLAGSDLFPTRADIQARFNLNLDRGECLGGSKWYYGLDANEGNDNDLVATAMHEFAHGLGFSSNTDLNTGSFRNGGLPGVYDTQLLDNITSRTWSQLDEIGRANSAASNNVVWNGSAVRTAAATFLAPTPFLRITAPSSIANSYAIGSAAFGGAVTATGTFANLVAAVDVAEPLEGDTAAGTTSDGCSAYSNASAVTGKFAFVDRGRCTFVLKARNAQDAGAIGIVIADNRAGSTPPGMAGTDNSVTIPVISILQADGAAIRAQLGNTVSMTLIADTSRLAGADNTGRVKIYAPLTIEGGSSISHWDVSSTPNLLMEPSINGDLTHTGDLTLPFFVDLGWTLMGSGGTPVEPGPAGPRRRIARR